MLLRPTVNSYCARGAATLVGRGSFRADSRFTGKEEDIEVGLQYFGKRFYAPLLQRWVSPDPLAVHAPGQADLNLYAYVHGRVLVAVDPVGLDCAPNQSCPSNAAAQPMSEGPSQATRDYAESVPGLGALQQKLDALPPPAPVQTQQGTAYPAEAQTTRTFDTRTSGGIRYATDVDSGKAFKATGEKPIEATESPVDLIGPAIVIGGVEASAMLARRLLLSMPEVRLSIPVVGMSDGPGGGGGIPVRLRFGGVKPPITSAGATPEAYSVAFETSVPKAGAGTRGAHFKAGNEALLSEMKANPEFASAMEKLQIKVPTSGTDTALGRSPKDWTWHHVPDRPGVLQLVAPASRRPLATPIPPRGRGRVQVVGGGLLYHARAELEAGAVGWHGQA